MTIEPAPEATNIPDLRPSGDIRELLGVRALRWLAWYRRFRQWFGSVWSGAARGASDLTSTAISGAQPAEEDVTLRPSYYQKLVDLPKHPDRPDLTRFEKSSEAEASAIEHVTRIVSRSVISGYCEVRKVDRAAKAMRGQHAKHHGCLQASFIVHQDLPPEFAVGVFRPGARYPAVVRFSNSKGFRESDKSLDGRGMAVKLRNVPGVNLLSAQLPQNRPTEQDFLISGHPVFFCRNVADYTAFMTMLDLPRTTRAQSIGGALKFIAFFLRRPPRVARAFIDTARRKVTSPLESDYHSMSPYLFGTDKVVRYVATPVARPLPSQGSRKELGDNYLHDALVDALNPARHPKGETVAFDFSIQIPARAHAGRRGRCQPAVASAQGREGFAGPDRDTHATVRRGQPGLRLPGHCVQPLELPPGA